ncbi:heat shock 70 kDa protein 12A [Pelomyxa schiedti]|nr:heat shock 70 kDa protein 12A [Pelomyxa schiedti]
MAGVTIQPQATAPSPSVATASTTKTKVCCAIDFGTSFTGFAFRDKRKIGNQRIVMAEWNSQLLHPKTPTEVVLAAAPPHELVEFGHEARTYMRNLDAAVARTVLHFKGFKMLLYGNDKKTEVFSTNQPRVSVSLKHLVTCILSHLALKALAQMRRDFPTEMDDVKWVITVPAIWDQSARAFMQECATGAGMKQVVLALEPEAASLAVKANLNFPIGTKYILVDAGGGTIDITVHECISTTQIAELHRPTGGPWGSSFINEYFFQLMGEVFGEDVVTKAQEDPGIFDLEDEVEGMKLTLSDSIPRHNISVYCIVSLLSQMSKPPFSQVVNDFNKSHPKLVDVNGTASILTLQNHKLRIDAALIKAKIEKLAAATSNHIQANLLPSLSGVKVAYLVGGLSRCEYYRQVMKTQLTGKLEVESPTDPSVAVLEGAVLFGESVIGDSVGSVKKRCMPHTYAVSTTDLAPRHPGRPTFQVDGQRRCEVLQVLVRSGESLDSDSEIGLEFSPISSDQDSITFDIFKSAKPNVMYPDEKGVELVRAGLQVNNLPGVGLPVKQRPHITLKLKFASTIITVQALCPGFPPIEAKWKETLE